MSSSQYSAIIFDIGDVLFSWSSKTHTSIPSQTLRRILASPTWFEYERGQISQDVCYARIASEFELDPLEIGRAFDEARNSMQCNEKMIELIRELKCQSQGLLRVFAMSNISFPDYEVLRTKPADWSLFDHVFTSAAAGQRKPNLGFYKKVIAEANIDPHSAIFLDDKSENVLSARSLGLHGIVFDNTEKVSRSLRNLTGDPVRRGREFLTKHAGKLDSVTGNGTILLENFAQLLLLEVTGDRSLVHLTEHPRTWNFFQGSESGNFPNDIDTTAVALTVLKPDMEIVNSVLDEVLAHLSSDGIIQTYFDQRRLHIDPVVCINALTLFYTYGRGADLHRTSEWIREVLLHRAYLEGTRYYRTPECFLFFLTRLLKCSDDKVLHELFDPLMKERVQELVGGDGDALTLAMRILASEYVGIANEVDLRKLLPLQCEDGSWETGWMYRFGTTGIRIGNRGLTTAMAINAIQAVYGLKSSRPPSPSQPQVSLEQESDPQPKPQDISTAPPPVTPTTETKLPLDHASQPESAPLPVVAPEVTPPSLPEKKPESTSRRFLRRASIAISTPTIERSLSPSSPISLEEPSSVRRKRHGRRSSLRLSFQWLQRII